MNSPADPTAHAVPPPDPADIARRIAERQGRLELTEEALARRAGMAPTYLRLLLTARTDFDPASLLRIAAALDLTYEELREGRSDPPPGQGPAPARPALVHLTTPECWDRLGPRGVGRIALSTGPGPTVLPVNYTADAGTIVYRTDPNGAAAPMRGTTVSFQVDHVDDHLSTGWSVLITGTAEHIDDVEAIQRLETAYRTEPWAGGNRPLWVRIQPDTISGRRIGTIGPDSHLH
ncbi:MULTISPECIES: helix-turn-helix domain-containing protein [Kitasatospora]|uniref:Nitroimidazol reductase NimA-like FMN-containing flavoprotein (Pyridoxamine 5'-phosphate oxidase superfamily) n=2 Tax=Kitasatospora TaxID=2063 RepID=A0ABT1J7H6_9ACTN|nr:pyridoxamine 5'-phosphate oxidase family protein [Kitasatospora paracochleata]MCP2313386.1 nitroimidazol reductase NimA-like FMN-containing flavoprotein (pyridoxamine 5'-phosphate oxidase superfamily) [Kitasatospora paracochleata]